MELTTYSLPARTRKTGEEGGVVLAAGKRLQIRTGTAGDITSHLDEAVPNGKEWTITVSVSIDETDA